MFIKKIELQNFQVIKEFHADFEGNVYFVTGDNELGKSTLLKAIGALLTGERDVVLKNGEDKGFAKMIVGGDGKEYEVKLSFTKANPRGSLTIKCDADGMKSDNLSTLNKLFGYTDYDAVEFSRWSETAEGRRKQIEVVKALLPEATRQRIEQLDAQIIELKAKRKDANAEAKTREIMVNAAEKKIANIDRKQYAQRIEIADLMQKQSENAQLIEKAKTIAATKARRIEELAAIPEERENAHAEIERKIAICEKSKQQNIKWRDDEIARINKEFNETMEELDTEIADLNEKQKLCDESLDHQQSDIEMRIANATKWLDEYEKNKPEDITEQIRQAEEHNRIYADIADWEAKKELWLDAQTDVQQYNDAIDNDAEERASLIAKSKLPIDGLTFTEDELELHGVPFIAGKVSDSQIMEVAAKLIIASNPNVKVFRIARGESLGEKRLQAIIEIAKANGFQGFIEEVHRGQENLIVEEYTEL